jgi:hypothetical protein
MLLHLEDCTSFYRIQLAFIEDAHAMFSQFLTLDPNAELSLELDTLFCLLIVSLPFTLR